MTQSRPTFASQYLQIEPWPDELVEKLGYDARSDYVEQYWLGILGPSTVWLIRRLVSGFDDQPDGYTIDLDETATILGLRNNGGKNSPFMRAITRTCQFGLARQQDTSTLAVRRKLPPVTQSQLRKLPQRTQDEHHRHTEERLRKGPNPQYDRAVNVAAGLITTGDTLEATRQQLETWQFDRHTATSAALEAWNQRHHPNRPEPVAQPRR